MIETKYYMTRDDGVTMNRTCSNKNMMIERDGIRYSEAIDPAELNRQYTETDEPIKSIHLEGTVYDNRIEQLELENADLIKQVEALQKRIDELEFESGGSVKPGGGDIPYDPVPGTDKPFKPKPGGNLTIGG